MLLWFIRCHSISMWWGRLAVLKSDWSIAGLHTDLLVFVYSHMKTSSQVHAVLLNTQTLCEKLVKTCIEISQKISEILGKIVRKVENCQKTVIFVLTQISEKHFLGKFSGNCGQTPRIFDRFSVGISFGIQLTIYQPSCFLYCRILRRRKLGPYLKTLVLTFYRTNSKLS